jgi:hypothetical protein
MSIRELLFAQVMTLVVEIAAAVMCLLLAIEALSLVYGP